MKTTITMLILLCVAAFAQEKGTFTDTRDKKTYKTVKIGEQIWMAENLNYNASGSKCYGNKPANCVKYGRLYDWNVALKACPRGWHLPNNLEWDKLALTVGDSLTGGKYLKATSGWKNNKNGNSGNGTDVYGFAALPGGMQGFAPDGDYFSDVGEKGYWWSSDCSKEVSSPCFKIINYNYEAFKWSFVYEGSVNLSVRCLQD